MDRRFRMFAAALAALAASSACQDYNFNPVGHCLIQPGTRRITLTDPSSADILFVVDDSGSMEGEQTALQANFSVFLEELKNTNVDRAGIGLEPLDFHIAVTSTAVYRNLPVAGGATCGSCGGAANVCCAGSAPLPVMCKPASGAGADVTCAPGYTCRSDCAGAATVGGSGCFDASCNAQRIPCSVPGRECGNLNEYYSFATCTPGYESGLFTANSEYPMGRFMADPAEAYTGDPDSLVLHFTKDLFTVPVEAADTTALTNLTEAFKQNVKVGTCGSGQETGLLAARMAIDRVRGVGGLAQPVGYAPGEFLHDKAKLVVVWVTDEDDCSAPATGSGAVVFRYTPPLTEPDVCELDAAEGGEHRQYEVSAFADYLLSLGRPVGAAFISSVSNSCTDASCEAFACCGANGNPNACGATCADVGANCGGMNASTRYVALADALAARGLEYGRDLLLGSVCDSFGASLGRIADLVKPPVGLVLPSEPAASEVAILRISDTSGRTLKTCRGPAPAAPAQPDEAAAKAYVEGLTSFDWWFTAVESPTTYMEALPSTVSRFVHINHATNACEANTGETYSADYIGRLPEDGCTDPEGVDSASCFNALGGSASQWRCEGYVPGVRNGSCICN